MKASVILTIAAVALAAIVIGLSMRKPDPTRPVLITSPYAPGQFLAATDVKWQTLWGQHAVTLNLSTTREGVSFSFPETALANICNEVLSAMPHAPDGVRKAEVYRVNIRKLGTQDVHLPMKVANGACADWKAGTVLFPNYPPPLQDWQLKSFETLRQGGIEGMSFTFSLVQGTDAAVEAKTFADACLAAMTEQVLIDRNLIQGLDGKIARIKLANDRDFAVVRFGTWQAYDFRVVSGACVPVEEGQKT